jgi:hypothetical protein
VRLSRRNKTSYRRCYQLKTVETRASRALGSLLQVRDVKRPHDHTAGTSSVGCDSQPSYALPSNRTCFVCGRRRFCGTRQRRPPLRSFDDNNNESESTNICVITINHFLTLYMMLQSRFCCSQSRFCCSQSRSMVYGNIQDDISSITCFAWKAIDVQDARMTTTSTHRTKQKCKRGVRRTMSRRTTLSPKPPTCWTEQIGGRALPRDPANPAEGRTG